MEKLTLKFWECMQLVSELAGFSDPKSGEVKLKGLLNEKVGLVTKYWLMELVTKLNGVKENIDKLREEMIKKYGKKNENGEVFIPIYEDEDAASEASTSSIESKKKLNPNFEIFQKDYSALLEQEHELEYKPIPIDALKNVETESNYVTVMKLIKGDA